MSFRNKLRDCYSENSGLSFLNIKVMIGHLWVRDGGIKLTKSVKRVKVLHEKSVVFPALDSQDDLSH